LITERTGLPLSVGISGANLHDSQALEPLVRGIPPIRSRRGPRRRRPAKLHADKGYDHRRCRQECRERGIEPGLADTLVAQTEVATRKQEQMGLVPVLLVPAPLRTLLSRFLRRTLPQLKVLSHAELPDSKTIRVTSLVGGQA